MPRNRGLVIFDIDGTLFRGADATMAAVAKAFGELGLPRPDQQEVTYLVGKPTSDLHAWLRSQCSEEQASQLVTAVDRYELDSVSNGAELYPGIPEVLDEIRTCVGQMAICTNGPQTYVERVVSAHNLRRFFDRVRCRRSGADTKVAMVRELLDQLSARPAVVVGDRQDDVEAAHQNGLQVVAVTYGYGSPDELKNADVVAASPLELPGLVKSLLDTT